MKCCSYKYHLHILLFYFVEIHSKYYNRKYGKKICVFIFISFEVVVNLQFFQQYRIGADHFSDLLRSRLYQCLHSKFVLMASSPRIPHFLRPEGLFHICGWEGHYWNNLIVHHYHRGRHKCCLILKMKNLFELDSNEKLSLELNCCG